MQTHIEKTTTVLKELLLPFVQQCVLINRVTQQSACYTLTLNLRSKRHQWFFLRHVSLTCLLGQQSQILSVALATCAPHRAPIINLFHVQPPAQWDILIRATILYSHNLYVFCAHIFRTFYKMASLKHHSHYPLLSPNLMRLRAVSGIMQI